MVSKIPREQDQVLCVKKIFANLTNQNEANRNEVRQHVTPDWFIVFSIALSKKANGWVEFILTKTLLGEQRDSSRQLLKYAWIPTTIKTFFA